MKQFPYLQGKVINDLAENIDLSKLTLDLKFDTIIFSYALRMIVNPKKIISDIAKKLSHEAILLIHEGGLINTNMLSLTSHQLYRQFAQQKINYFTNHGLKYLMESNFLNFINFFFTIRIIFKVY